VEVQVQVTVLSSSSLSVLALSSLIMTTGKSKSRGSTSRHERLSAARHAKLVAFARNSVPESSATCFTKRRMTGDLPTFNDWSSVAVDHERQKLYMYGGRRPGDKMDNPTSDFHCCDIRTMRWKNYTVCSTLVYGSNVERK
jgi:hypothetical protein